MCAGRAHHTNDAGVNMRNITCSLWPKDSKSLNILIIISSRKKNRFSFDYKTITQERTAFVIKILYFY
jgi:hypothetical protein